MPAAASRIPITRIQTGLRLEKRMVKVLKAVAEYYDMSMSALVEEIVLHAFEGPGAFAFGKPAVKRIREFRRLYGMDYGVHDSPRFAEKPAPTRR